MEVIESTRLYQHPENSNIGIKVRWTGEIIWQGELPPEEQARFQKVSSETDGISSFLSTVKPVPSGTETPQVSHS